MEGSLVSFTSKYQAFVPNLNTPVGDYLVILTKDRVFLFNSIVGKITQKWI